MGSLASGYFSRQSPIARPRSMSFVEHLRRVSNDAGSLAKKAESSTGSRGNLSTAPSSPLPAPISGSQIRVAPTSRHSVTSFDIFFAVCSPLNHSSRTRSAESCASPCALALAASSVRA